ncbi:MAG TPA: proline dehydrogenase family protein [Acidimicrobiia bacterium]|nr:proline dehydrogenase family protein [Acidimicrobiia bacterium]
MSLFSRMVIALTEAGPVERTITGTRPGKSLARRFVAGDTLDDGVAAAHRLNEEGFLVSLDLLGEECFDRATAFAARDEYLEGLDRIGQESLRANISIKLTQLGLAFDESLAIDLLDSLAERASALGTTVTIDMEDSRYTEATVGIYEKAQSRHGNLGIALQAYLHRTAVDLRRLLPLGGHIRLCKGAYVEEPDVAIRSNADIDHAFGRLLGDLMSFEEVRPAIATHDGALISLTRDLAKQRKAPFEFQMLYGVRTTLQRELADAGYPVRVYLPFGSKWYPYLTRRLAERPSNAWFFLRSVFES